MKWFRLDLETLSLIIPWIGMNAVLAGGWALFQHGARAFRSPIWKIHLFRSVVVFMTFLVNVYALKYISLTLNTSLLPPFFLTLLAWRWPGDGLGNQWGRESG